VTSDEKNDLLRVRYDPEKVTPDALRQEVAALGFEATVVPDR
jgi:hypothetical protein